MVPAMLSLWPSGVPCKILPVANQPYQAPDPPQSWLNAGSFPDALRCRDFPRWTRSQKTLGLETYSYSPERKDCLRKPHPFTATRFPFLFPDLTQWYFFFFSAAWCMVSGSLLLSLFHPHPQVSPPFAWEPLTSYVHPERVLSSVTGITKTQWSAIR